MKKSIVCIFFASLLAGASAHAGNEDKRGQVGATELQINPWARSSGWANANTARIRGVESMNQNIGGLAHVKGLEINAATSRWLSGSDTYIYALGIGKQLGENGGVIGLSLMSVDMGEFKGTDENNPDVNNSYEVSMLNLGLSYSKIFSNSIYGGITVRVINESLPNVSATGIAFDAGVQYTTTIGKSELAEDNLHIGVSLRNVGPEMQYSGDGLARRGFIENGGDGTRAIEARSESFELPALLNIGLAYDINLTETHRITLAGNFVSNSAINDQIQVGAEYAFNEKIMVRGGFDYQKGIFSDDRNFAHTGPTAGLTLQVPVGGKGTSEAVDPTAPLDVTKKNRTFGIDYSFRASNPWSGTHSLGIKLSL